MVSGLTILEKSIPSMAYIGREVEVYIILKYSEGWFNWGSLVLDVTLHGVPGVPQSTRVTLRNNTQQTVGFSFIMPAANLSVYFTVKNVAGGLYHTVSTSQVTITARLPDGTNVIGDTTPPPGTPGGDGGTNAEDVNVPQMVGTCTLEPTQFSGHTSWKVRDIKGNVLYDGNTLEQATYKAAGDLRCKQTYKEADTYTGLTPDDITEYYRKLAELEKAAAKEKEDGGYGEIIIVAGIGLLAIVVIYLYRRRS